MSASGHYASSSVIQDYAEDLGFEYFSADSKDSFDNICSKFFSSDKSDKPFLLEVITKDKDEEFALETLRTLCFEEDKKTHSGGVSQEVSESVTAECNDRSEENHPCSEEERLKRELDAISHSISFRLGRKLTWLPRKLRNLIRRVMR